MTARRDVQQQLQAAGLTRWFLEHTVSADGMTVLGVVANPSALIVHLTADPRWLRGSFYGLHRDVGSDLTDFRSLVGTFGRGSLQVCLDRTTGALYADVDHANPYEDARYFLIHTGEVVAGWWRRLWQ